VDKIKLIGEHGNGLYLADQYIKNIALSRKK
ncbi:ferritin, partial [Campylobacter jejuni]